MSLRRDSVRPHGEHMFVMAKKAERLQARRLRAEEGESVRVIASRVGVAASSVSRWVRDIPLTEAQLAALRDRDPRFNKRVRGTEGRRAHAAALRAEWQERGRQQARSGDALHMAGCMLHWGEGSKHRNAVTFTNSDVDMMRLFIRFLRECCSAEGEALRFSVNCFLGNGLTLSEIEAYWLSALELPSSSLRKATVNRASSASRRSGRILLHGTGRLVLHSTAVAQSIYGAIQEYGGFERPEWLD